MNGNENPFDRLAGSEDPGLPSSDPQDNGWTDPGGGSSRG